MNMSASPAASISSNPAPTPSSWVVANAGSGKTYTLTWRVVGLLMGGAVPETIWCVTYTKAAAAEMHERLMVTLKQMFHANDEALLEMLRGPLAAWAQPEHVQRARSLYHMMLERPHGGVRFTTMHGLCQWLIGAFPLEAGVPAGVALLDAPDASRLKRAAIASVLADEAQHYAPLRDALMHIRECANYGHATDLVHAFLEHEARYPAPFSSDLANLRADLLRAQDIPENASSDAEKQAFIDASPPDYSAAIAALAPSKSKTDTDIFPALEGWLHASPAARAERYESYIAAFITKTDGTARKTLHTKGALSPDSDASQALYREQMRVMEHLYRLGAISLAEDTASLRIVARAAADLYQQRKASAAALDYEDLLHVCSRLLSAPEMMGWVMHKLDYRLSHLLVDEAQDTSPIQWRIIETLCNDIIAQGSHDDGDKSVFVVGDDKQSIYSFNGAAPELLPEVEKRIAAQLPNGLVRQTLGTSYRSSAAVLDVVNAMCEAPEMLASFSTGGAAAHQLHHMGRYGRVECWPACAGEKAQSLPPYTMPTAPALKGDAKVALAKQIAEQLAGRILGMPLASGTVQPRDVLILVRNRGPIVGYMSKQLLACGVPVAGLDRLKLAEDMAVKDMMALMAWCLQPADNVSLAQMLVSPLCGWSQDALLALAHPRGEISLYAALCEAHPDIAATLESWRVMAPHGAYALCQHLLDAHGMAARFCARMGSEVLEILDEFLLFLQSRHEEGADGLVQTLALLRNEAPIIKREQQAGGSENAVRIMTVHGAKGLEAPVVILADTIDTPTLSKEKTYRDSANAPWFNMRAQATHAPLWETLKTARKAELNAEYYRLLYVAATRAKSMLIVTGTKSNESKTSNWYQLMRAAMVGLGAVEEGDILVHASGDVPDVTAGGPSHEAPNIPTWLHEAPTLPTRMPHLRPSDVGGGHEITYAEAATDHDPRAYGDCFHALMEWAAPDVADTEITAFAALHDQDAVRLVREFRGLWDNSEVAALLALRAKPEQNVQGTLMWHGREHSMRGQIDRLIITDTQCIILDYKTSLHPPETMPEQYKAQLASYAALLRTHYPNHAMRAALLWSANARLDWLEDNALSALQGASHDLQVT